MKSTRQSSNEFYGNVVLGDSISDAHSVTGSLSVSGSTSVTGSITATNIIKTINTTNSTTWTNGAMVVDGGVGIGKDTWISGSLNVIGNFNVLGSSSTINLTSSQLVVEDNIITVNGYSPYLRYAGIEAIDSGSAVTASLLWDGQGDYWLMVSSSNQSSRLLGTTYGEFGSETSLTSGYIPKITGGNTIANGVLFQSSSNIGYGTTTPAEPVVISANGSVIEFATVNNGAYGVRVNQAIKATSFYMYNSSGTINAFNGTILISAPDTGNKLSFLSDKMFISSSGNVGIGTATPSAKLHIYEANTNAILKLESDGADDSTDIIIDRPNTVRRSDVQFTTADTIDWVIGTIYNGGSANSKFSISTTRDLVDSKIVVDTTGNVGIGTTSPAYNLDIIGSAGIRLSSGSGAGALMLIPYKTGHTYHEIASAGGNEHIAISPGSVEAMRIMQGTGRVGIGTTNPLYSLDVRGASAISGSVLIWSGNRVSIDKTSTGTSMGGGYFEFINGTGITFGITDNADSNHIIFKTRPTDNVERERARITSAGNVGIGISAPTSKLHISSSVVSEGLFNIQNVSGASLMYVSSSGNAGLGTDSPLYKLDVRQDNLLTNPNTYLGLSNTTAADATNTLQVSPGLIFEASSWNGAASVKSYIRMYSKPSPGGSYHQLYVDFSADKVTWSNAFSTQQSWLMSSNGFAGNTAQVNRITTYSNTPRDLEIGPRSTSDSILFGGGYATLTEWARFKGGNLGIGIAAPTSKLHISSSVASEGLLNIQNVSGNSLMYVSSSGNVGIGTSNPTSLFQVEKDYNGQVDVAIVNKSTGSNAIAYFNFSSQDGGSGGFWASGPTTFAGLGSQENTFAIEAGSNTKQLVLKSNSVSGSIKFVAGSWNPLTHTKMIVSASGQIGIGTLLPNAKLHISGSTASEGLLNIQNSSGSNMLYVSSSGNVGIGTATPSQKLDVNGNVLITGSLTTSGSITAIGAVYIHNVGVDKKMQFQRTGGNTFSIEHDVSSMYLYNETTSKPVMTWYNGGNAFVSGNLGVGTTSPGSALHVVGGGAISGNLGLGDNNPALYWKTGNDIRLGISTDGIGSSGFSEKMRITSGGNVGIGTTTPQSTLSVRGTTPTFNIEASNFTHGFDTSLYSRPNSFGAWSYYSGTKGGSLLVGIGKVEIPGVVLWGVTGETSPTVSPVQFVASKRNDVTPIGLASTEKAFSFHNGGSSWAVGTELITIMGDGKVGIGITNPTSSLNVVATLPSTPASSVQGVLFNITGAGSTAQRQTAIVANLISGYTGAALSTAGTFQNYSAGTGAGFVIGNVGAIGAVDSTTTGTNSGFISYAVNRGAGNAVGGAGVVYGGLGTGAKVGLVGMASNEAGGSGARIGVLALGGGTYDSGLPSVVSAALLADNQARAVPIFIARDNGTEVFRISDGGDLISTATGASTTFGSNIAGANYPRMWFKIGNSASDVNAGLSIAPEYTSAGVTKPAYLEVCNNKVGADSSARNISMAVYPTYTSIHSLGPQGNSAGLPMILSTQNAAGTSPAIYISSASAQNVGIGTASPGAKLTISGGEGSYTAPTFGSGNLGSINIYSATSGTRNAITFSSAGTSNAQAGIYVHQDNGAGTHMYLATTDSYAYGPQARLTILNNGNTGVGTIAPNRKLEVSTNASDVPSIRAAYNTSNYQEFAHDRIDIIGSNTWKIQRVGVTALAISSSGNVGIGTTTPAVKLDVNGSYHLRRPATLVDAGSTLGGTIIFANSDFANGANGYLQLSYPDTSSIRLGTAYDGNLTGYIYRDIQLGRYNNPYVTIKDGGNVGIGTTTPTSKLDVIGAIKAESLEVTSSVRAINLSGGGYIGWGGSNTSIYGATSGNMQLKTGDGTTRVFVSSSGNIGINTSSPIGRLDIEGTSGQNFVVDAQYATPSLKSAAGNNIWVATFAGSDSAIMTLHYLGATKISLAANDVSYFNGGNVGIGTATPATKLHVNGTISSSKMILDNGDINNPTLVFAGSTTTGLYYDNGIRPNATFYTRDVIPGVNNAFDLGSSSFKYRTLYLSSSLVTSTIHNNGSTLTISGSTVVSGSFTVAYPSNGTAILKSYAAADGSYKAGDFWVLGDLYVGPGSSKYFIANNPDGITTKTDSVKYVAIEGPSKSVFNHGKAFIKNKSIEIDLPPEWKWLVDDTSISVTLTPINKYAKLTYEIKNNKLIVYNKSWFKRNVNFSYQLIADRKDVEKLKVYDEFPLQS